MTTDKDTDVTDYLKPKKFRDRKTHHGKPEAGERNHPKHPPYKREHLNYLVEDEDSGWGGG